jgi:quercetin dioxygenase-like cupin family protein
MGCDATSRTVVVVVALAQSAAPAADPATTPTWVRALQPSHHPERHRLGFATPRRAIVDAKTELDSSPHHRDGRSISPSRVSGNTAPLAHRAPISNFPADRTGPHPRPPPMPSIRTLLACTGVAFAAGAALASAQQQAQTSRREEQFTNEQLKVWKTTVMPGAPLAMHRHEHGRALVALTDGQLQVTDKDGTVLDTYQLKVGKAMWLAKDPPGQLHADVNPGTKPIEVMVVQLQQDTVATRR